MGKAGNVETVATKSSALKETLETIAFLLCPFSFLKVSRDAIREDPNMPTETKIMYYGVVMSAIELFKIGTYAAAVYEGYQLLRHIH